jgi:parallel beta-helix repeat protein
MISVKANPTKWIVDAIPGQGNFTKIEDAINSANSGDTIFVHSGTYYENLLINKTITIIGENRDSTIIYGSEDEPVIKVNADGVSISEFTIQKNASRSNGISIEGASNITIYYNKIIGSYNGISMHSSSNSTISNNIISDNIIGIYAISITRCLISDNTVSHNTFGICISTSNYNVIFRNSISYNDVYGINLEYSRINEICYNTIYYNIKGITLRSCKWNTIYCNNFDNYLYQALSDSFDFWSYENEGNYWSNYEDQDLNMDGIGDSPFVIDAFNKDNFPLVGTASNFPVTVGNKNYNISIISNAAISNFGFEISYETGNRIICFNISGDEEFFNFIRIAIPAELMPYPYIVFVNDTKVTPTCLNISVSYVRLLFTHLNQAKVSIVSSELLSLYNDLLAKYNNLNLSYTALLDNYRILLENYSKLLSDYSIQGQIIQNFRYVAAFSTAVLIAAIFYLSKRAHTGSTLKVKMIKYEE